MSLRSTTSLESLLFQVKQEAKKDENEVSVKSEIQCDGDFAIKKERWKEEFQNDKTYPEETNLINNSTFLTEELACTWPFVPENLVTLGLIC